MATEIVVSGGSLLKPYYTFKERLTGAAIDISTYAMVPGKDYKFVNGGISDSHPFYISDTGRRKIPTFTITSPGATHLTGIRANGAQYLQFTLPATFKGSLTYYCTAHTVMTNTFKLGPVVPPPTKSPTKSSTKSPTKSPTKDPKPELPVCCMVFYEFVLETCPMPLLSHDSYICVK